MELEHPGRTPQAARRGVKSGLWSHPIGLTTGTAEGAGSPTQGLPTETGFTEKKLGECAERPYSALHSFGQIPTYEEGGLTLFESGAIVFHIAERYADLLPDDANGRVRAITWMFAALALKRGDRNGNSTIELSELVAHVQDQVPKICAKLHGRGRAASAARGVPGAYQSARFGSRGEDFAVVRQVL